MGISSIGKHGSLFIMYFKTPAQYKNVQSAQCHRRLLVLRYNSKKEFLRIKKENRRDRIFKLFKGSTGR